MNLYYANVTLHVLAALFWLGGMFFLGVVGAPVLRTVEPPALRAQLFASLGARFRSAGWIAIAILIVTGLINLNFRGLLGATLLDPGFWGTRYGIALGWKFATVVLMITISAIHDFILGPAAGRMKPGSPDALAARRKAAILARVNAFVGVLLVIAAVRLARGG